MYTKIDRDCDRESEMMYLEEGREWCFGGIVVVLVSVCGGGNGDREEGGRK